MWLLVEKADVAVMCCGSLCKTFQPKCGCLICIEQPMCGCFKEKQPKCGHLNEPGEV